MNAANLGVLDVKLALSMKGRSCVSSCNRKMCGQITTLKFKINHSLNHSLEAG